MMMTPDATWRLQQFEGKVVVFLGIYIFSLGFISLKYKEISLLFMLSLSVASSDNS